MVKILEPVMRSSARVTRAFAVFNTSSRNNSSVVGCA
jgi:hypothetical protein